MPPSTVMAITCTTASAVMSMDSLKKRLQFGNETSYVKHFPITLGHNFFGGKVKFNLTRSQRNRWRIVANTLYHAISRVQDLYSSLVKATSSLTNPMLRFAGKSKIRSLKVHILKRLESARSINPLCLHPHPPTCMTILSGPDRKITPHDMVTG